MKHVTRSGKIALAVILIFTFMLLSSTAAFAGGIWADSRPNGGIWADRHPSGGIWADSQPNG